MSLRHGLLGLIAEGPRSGYDLTKTFDQSPRFVWYAGHSQIYPEFARLHDEGLIEQVDEGPRGKRIYRITRAGRSELRYWLLETKPNRTTRNEALMRYFFHWTLKPREAEALLLQEREFHRVGLERYETMIEEVRAGKKMPPWGELPLQLGLHYKHAMLEWIDKALAEARARKRRAARKRA